MVIKLLKNTHTIKARDREILLRQGRFVPRLMEWSPLSKMASKCQSGNANYH